MWGQFEFTLAKHQQFVEMLGAICIGGGIFIYMEMTADEQLYVWIAQFHATSLHNQHFSSHPECSWTEGFWSVSPFISMEEENDWGDCKHFYKSTAQDQEEGVRVGAVLISQKWDRKSVV